ncbi:MAG TPA: hypothetical protein VIZ64_11165 [Dokdonella sp.]
MPSSISSSEPGAPIAAGFVRQTASDRPGVAQPAPEREIPAQPWRPISLCALLLAALLVAGWEAGWRAFGATPGHRNSDGAWAVQRRRIDAGEGNATVLIGSSRVLFDVQLPVWERLAGERPIQLALEGTSPIPFLEDLADDTDFTGRLLVGVTPGTFFGAAGRRSDLVAYYRDQGPSQRSGHWLSSRLLEPRFAFLDPDFALATVVRRQRWPARPGLPARMDVRKLMTAEADRNTRLWRKVEVDPSYRALARRIWAQGFDRPPPTLDTLGKRSRSIDEQIGRAQAAVARLRARGVPVVFVRPPSSGPYHASEQALFPRDRTWDLLLQRTGVPGIHFEDHPELQGLDLPEWSHLSAADAERYTAALWPHVERAFGSQRAHPAGD